MKSARLLVIGNGGAAIHAIKAIRAAGHQGSVQLLSDVSGPAFNPLLSPYFLAGKIDFDQCFPFGSDFYKKYDIDCHFGVPAERLDPVNREVYLEGGKRLSYDRCLIATGAGPALPDVTGLRGSSRVFTLRTPKDTIFLKQTLSTARNAVVLGASLAGLKLTEILIQRKIRVTLVDVADQVLPHAAHPACAAFLGEQIIGQGVELRLGWKLDRAEDRRDGLWLHFQDVPPLTTDLCLVFTGVHPNLELLEQGEVAMDRGVLIDDRMCTSAGDLYAAGDVSQGMNSLSGKREVFGLWANACYQGRAAGCNMGGADLSHAGTIPQHVNTFFGLEFARVGDVRRQGERVTTLSSRDLSSGAYRLLVFDGGVLVGVNLINDVQLAGKLKRAIALGADWGRHLERFVGIPTDQEMDQILASFQT